MRHPNYVRQGDGKLQISPDAYDAPRLSKALLTGNVGQYDLLKTPLQKEIEAKKKEKITLYKDFDKELPDLLQHLQDRLDMGCMEAWLSELGYGLIADKKQIEDHWKTLSPPSEPRAQVDFVKKNEQKMFEFGEHYKTPEEIWARAFAEMVVFSAYQNPPLIHYWSQDGKPIYSKYPQYYAIGMACQFLSTYCILSRGFSAADIADGCACSGTTIGLPCFEPGKSQTSPPLPAGAAKQTAAPGFATTTALKDKEAKPGSAVSFNPGGPTYTGQDKGAYTHIGSVLRRHGEYVQFIDTGVLVGKGEGAGGEGGTVDHEFAIGAIPQAQHLVGMAIIKNEPGNLVQAAESCRSCRPLGFARLAIVDITKPEAEVRYVSKMFHMKYPLSRFLWSLRGLPVEGLRVLWMLYMPNGADFSDAYFQSPTGTPDAIYSAAKATYEPKRKQGEAEQKTKEAAAKAAAAASGKPPTPVPRWVDTHPFGFYLVNILRGEPSGSAVVCRRKSDKKDGYVENFEGPPDAQLPSKPKAEMGQGLKLDLAGEPTLGGWVKGNLDQQYVKKPGAKGESNTGAAGGSFMT